jgi:uncharacterized protein YdhG (YjbR/CyaY superfamily)
MNDMTVIDEYLEKVEPKQKAELEKIRAFVKKHVPDAEEVISYGMPAFKYKGSYLIGYAAYKDHMSVFPTPEPIVELQEELKGFEQAKGTVQFTLEHLLPLETIGRLVDARLAVIKK